MRCSTYLTAALFAAFGVADAVSAGQRLMTDREARIQHCLKAATPITTASPFVLDRTGILAILHG
jgi:hypothetical protein